MGTLYSSSRVPARLLFLIITLTAALGVTANCRAASTPTLSCTPALTHVQVVQGLSATDVFTISSNGSFNGPVTLTTSGLPAGVTASWSKSPVTLVGGSGSTTLTLAASASAVANWFKFTVTATGNGLTVSTLYTVEVNLPRGAQLKVWVPAVSMQSAGSISLDLEAIPVGGVALSSGLAGSTATLLSALPAGVTATWSSPVVTSSGAVLWTLTLAGSRTAVASTGTLGLSVSIKDASSGIVYSSTQSLPLTVSLSAPTLNLAAAQSHIPVIQGGSATDVFTLTSAGSFHGAVTLTASGLPAGVSAVWSTNPFATGTGSTTLTLTASKTAVSNWFPFTVTASGDGLTVSTANVVEVNQPLGTQIKMWISTLSMQSMGTTSFALEAIPVGGLTLPAGTAGTSARVVSGLPAGVNATWSSPTVTTSGAVMWTLTLTGSSAALASSSSLIVSATLVDAGSHIAYTSSQAVPLAVTLTPPTLILSPALTHLPVIQGSTATDVFTLTGGGSFHGAVTLSVSGLPAGVSASWSSNPVTLTAAGGSSTLTLTASTSATVNWFKYTVTANGNGVMVATDYTVEVEPLIGLQVQLSNSALSLAPRSSAALTVTAIPRHGVLIPQAGTGASARVTSTLPTGVNAAWSQPTMSAAGLMSWTLTLTADAAVPMGSDPIGLAVTIVDATSGTPYSVSSTFNVLVGLLAEVSVDETPGVRIPPTFMGLSQEWGVAQSMMGSSKRGVNLAYRQLLNNLTAYGSQPVELRIGGNSTDTTSEPTPTTVLPFAELAGALGSRFVIGVNLGANNVALATDQAKAYLSQMPVGSVEAIEIGNEPDAYASNGYRAPTYTTQDYYSDFYKWQQGLSSFLPTGTKLMGASWASTSMLPNIQTFEANFAATLAITSQHFYASDQASAPALDFLLTPSAATAGPSQVAAAVLTTHALGIPIRIGEINSISGGGVHGISDAFGAALWSIDIMFEFANVGVDGVNWQSPGGFYSPFQFSTSLVNGMNTYRPSPINPLYYGLLFFQAATGSGAQILPVTISAQANLKAWATLDATSTPRLTLINKDEGMTGTVAVTFPGYSQATVQRLSAPAYTSTTGVTFAGQTFDGSTDGTIQGTQTVETIYGSNGVFNLPMPVTSAALVVFQR